MKRRFLLSAVALFALSVVATTSVSLAGDCGPGCCTAPAACAPCAPAPACCAGPRVLRTGMRLLCSEELPSLPF